MICMKQVVLQQQNSFSFADIVWYAWNLSNSLHNQINNLCRT